LHAGYRANGLTSHCTFAGGAFDPLGLASEGDSKAFRLKTAEIKHGRLAMIAFLGMSDTVAITLCVVFFLQPYMVSFEAHVTCKALGEEVSANAAAWHVA